MWSYHCEEEDMQGSGIVEDVEEITTRLDSLQFTGNWFIDAGILGFVNLMEEVYKFPDAIELIVAHFNKFSEKDIKNCFYYAYMIYHIRETTKKLLDKTQLSKKDRKTRSKIDEQFEKSKIEIQKLLDFKKEEPGTIATLKSTEIRDKIRVYNERIRHRFVGVFDDYQKNKLLKKTVSQNKKTPVEKVSGMGLIIEEPFFQNLPFLNPSVNKKSKEDEIFDGFENLLYLLKVKKADKKGDPKIFDKTISKFMFSEEEFPNVIYGKALNLEGLSKFIPNSHIYMLCFPIAFISIAERGYRKNIFFYTPNLNTCYRINKTLEKKKEMVDAEKKVSLFKLTWSAIIDEITELESYFTLEYMYLIEYEGIKQQALLNVEYIGIPKLQASIILNDAIRDALNRRIQTREGSGVWLLEELVKNKPLFPHIFNHLRQRISNNKIYTNPRTLLYALSVDAQIKYLGEGKHIKLFTPDFFKGYRAVVFQIKNDFGWLMGASKNIRKILTTNDEREKIAYPLISVIRKGDKYAFSNILLKAFLNKSNRDPKAISYLNKYLFYNIIPNEINWGNYALAIVTGLVYGGDESG